VPWSGAPDSVRCTTIQCPVHQSESTPTPQLRVSQVQLRYNSPNCPVCHRTIRCTNGATTICAQRSSLTNEQCSTVLRQKSEQQIRGAPVCLVPHEDKASNGRPAPSLNDRMTWRRTGHCPVAHWTLFVSSLLQRLQFGWWL
jgi:hypothetical protein